MTKWKRQKGHYK